MAYGVGGEVGVRRENPKTKTINNDSVNLQEKQIVS